MNAYCARTVQIPADYYAIIAAVGREFLNYKQLVCKIICTLCSLFLLRLKDSNIYKCWITGVLYHNVILLYIL